MSTEFAAATAVHPRGDGTYGAELSVDWSVGDKPHGGYLMAVLARAGLAALGDDRDPLALSAEFLRPPSPGPVTLRPAVVKTGRSASVVTVAAEQEDRACVTATLTAGSLPDERSQWADLPGFPAEPAADALVLGTSLEGPSKVGKLTGTRLDRHNTAVFTDGTPGDPLSLRGWSSQPDGPPDVLYALVIGDILPPLTFNLGRLGWSPTVQMTALLRGRPAPGWLRVQADCRTVAGAWFDSDHTVVDATGRLVCQQRQLALTAR